MDGLLPDLELIRKDFPILQRTLAGGFPLVYLDSANTSQKPQVVIDTMVDHLERHNANVARAMHQLGAESSEAFEDARDKVAAFINAPSRDEVLFTKNASEALNLVANTLAWRGPLQAERGLGAVDRDGWQASIAYLEDLGLVPNPITIEDVLRDDLLPAGD